MTLGRALSSRSDPALSRRCRAARGRRWPGAGRGTRTAPPGRRPAARRRSPRRRPRPGGASRLEESSRSWVAHAVESARMVSTPSTKSTGVQCWAISGPTICGHRPMTAPTATSTAHPRSTTNWSSWSPSSFGSRPPTLRSPTGTSLVRRRGFSPGRSPLALAAARARASAAAAASAASPTGRTSDSSGGTGPVRLARRGGIGWGRGGLVVTHSGHRAQGHGDTCDRRALRARPPGRPP